MPRTEVLFRLRVRIPRITLAAKIIVTLLYAVGPLVLRSHPNAAWTPACTWAGTKLEEGATVLMMVVAVFLLSSLVRHAPEAAPTSSIVPVAEPTSTTAGRPAPPLTFTFKIKTLAFSGVFVYHSLSRHTISPEKSRIENIGAVLVFALRGLEVLCVAVLGCTSSNGSGRARWPCRFIHLRSRLMKEARLWRRRRFPMQLRSWCTRSLRRQSSRCSLDVFWSDFSCGGFTALIMLPQLPRSNLARPSLFPDLFSPTDVDAQYISVITPSSGVTSPPQFIGTTPH
ncbi:hypothetical protein DFH09DRAFT_203297 [Mycena vulgaris]|nr:hypothetical protein DFH09DRAFT_203297 [Mycena vulgaris]